MKRPESRLAAGAVVCVAAVAMLVNVTLVSCEETGASSHAWGQPGGAAQTPLDPTTSPGGQTPIAGAAGDFRVSRIVREPEMRVRLIAATDRIVISSGAAGFSICPEGGTPTGALRAPAAVRLGGGGWVVTRDGGRGTDGPGAPLAVLPPGTPVLVTPAAGTELTINGATYPGRVRLAARSDVSDRAFDVIEHVALEEYLPGVVAKEMLAGWPLAAYQVQAVCARTYALHEQARTAGSGRAAAFDVEASERDQAYAGSTRNRLAVDAVRSTRGWILADGDRILRAYFSSTCGGRTASAADTWPTGPGFEFNLAAPLQANPRETACQNAPLYRWSVRRDREELVQRLRAFGDRSQLQVRQIRDLWAIEPMTVNSAGRPSAYKVVEPGGKWYRLSGEQLRLALNQSVSRGVTSVGAGVVSTTAGYGVTGGVVGAEGDAELIGPMQQTPSPPPDVDRRNRVPSGDMEVSGPRAGAGVSIAGRGFGHGVGMCQYCAKAFAERGEDWRRMVLRFYPGAALVAAY